MALNLGRPAYDAIQRLKNNSDWRVFVASLEEQMSGVMHQALDVAVDHRVDATGYARGLRDIVAHIQLVEQPQPAQRVPKPNVKAQPQANV